MQLLARIQAHPTRKALATALAIDLKPLPVEISYHESQPASPWLGYLQALSNLPDCSHVLIIQDDARPCPNFAEALEKVIEEHPDLPICLFLSRLPSRWYRQATLAMKRRTPFFRIRPSSNEFFPVVAIVWPAEIAQALHEWGQKTKQIGPRPPRSDDNMTAKFLLRTKQDVVVVVPSLVEHPDTVASTKGRNDIAWGKNTARVAAYFAGT